MTDPEGPGRSSRSITGMRVVVELGDWEHACCGPAYERDALVEVTCLAVRGFDDSDDGHLEQPWTGLPVTADSEAHLLTLDT